MSAIDESTTSDSSEPNTMQMTLYESHVDEWEEWLLTYGKEGNGSRAARKPLAETTVRNYVYRVKAIFPRVWASHRFMLPLDREYGTEYLLALDADDVLTDDGNPYRGSSKKKQEMTLRKYFEWRTIEFDAPDWEPEVSFRDDSFRHRDYFTISEREQLRSASMSLRDIPSYSDLSPEERNRWRTYLSYRLDKPQSEVSPTDWEEYRTNWKIPSLMMVSIDGGLRPCEVGAAKAEWYDESKQALLIPVDESAKNENYWEVSLRNDTALALTNWLRQRENYSKYDGRDEIWLTRHENPYGSRSLNFTLRKLMDRANIDYGNRPELTWYAIRRSTATYVASKGNMAEAADQLRHNSLETTRRYTNTPVEDRKDTLEEL